MVPAACPRCATDVALHEGRAVVRADGAIIVWHRACWDARDIPIAPPVAYPHIPPPRASRRMMQGLLVAIVVSSVVSMGIAQWSWAEIAPPPPASAAVLTLGGEAEPLAFHAERDDFEAEVARPVVVETAVQVKYPIPVEHDRPLDELYPSLHDWVHPVTASKEYVPTEKARQFGEPREAIKDPRPDCGLGHCGIDLDGPEGRPIAAVADGVVLHVDNSELGADGMSGRFVWIRHDDGTTTSYMHLDTIADGLSPGDHVIAGEFVGTLGSTATYVAPAHLHFALQIPNHPGHRDDPSDSHFVDPAPFLARATIIPVVTKRREERVAF
jgi:murein DD-endopeptidase MepM/ murein hydrolase activator NlpD